MFNINLHHRRIFEIQRLYPPAIAPFILHYSVIICSIFGILISSLIHKSWIISISIVMIAVALVIINKFFFSEIIRTANRIKRDPEIISSFSLDIMQCNSNMTIYFTHLPSSLFSEKYIEKILWVDGINNCLRDAYVEICSQDGEILVDTYLKRVSGGFAPSKITMTKSARSIEDNTCFYLCRINIYRVLNASTKLIIIS